MISDLSIRLRNSFDELKRLRETLHEYCGFRELPSNVVFALTLSLDEIVTNVISYGYDDHDEHQIEVTIRSSQGVIEASVVDDGKPFNPLEFRTPDLKCPIDEWPIGGLGIYLVKNYMSELEYKRVGVKNCLTMRKRF
ncbi:MAG TPA: ATP-binding protein [Thermodesulfobacteriota bacterium]|nr:ATP-binding protein [Thermodesulfobacteriota bacterium]